MTSFSSLRSTRVSVFLQPTSGPRGSSRRCPTVQPQPRRRRTTPTVTVHRAHSQAPPLPSWHPSRPATPSRHPKASDGGSRPGGGPSRTRGGSAAAAGETTVRPPTFGPQRIHRVQGTTFAYRIPFSPVLDVSADAGGYGGYQQPPSRSAGGYYDRRGARPGSPEPAGGCAEWGSRWGERGPRAPDGAGVRDRQPPASAPTDAPAYGRAASW